MVNKSLLLETLEYIRQNPDEWYQQEWNSRCGTKFCFAGHAAIKAGFPLPLENTCWEATIDGNYYHVADFAEMKLNLTSEQADALFGGDNDFDDLERMIHLLIEDPRLDFHDLFFK